MKKILLSTLAFTALFLNSCSTSDDSTPTGPSTENLSGNLTTDLRLENNGTEYVLNGALFVKDGATLFTEVGPGKVLVGLVGKIDREAATANA